MSAGLAIFLFQLIVLIFSVIIHEVSHGVVAEKLGDPTARLAGRITLNPISHIDPFGSIILPALLALPAIFGAPTIIVGWAKPVPYNPMLLKNPRIAAGQIAVAGPISNIILAVIFGVIIRLGIPEPLSLLFQLIVFINLLLAIFNLVPIPPLDGSKVLFALLPTTEWARSLEQFLHRYGLMLLLLLIFFGLGYLFPIIGFFFQIIVGHPFGI